MHLCMASSIRAMPEKEKPPAMRVDLYFLYIFSFLHTVIHEALHGLGKGILFVIDVDVAGD